MFFLKLWLGKDVRTYGSSVVLGLWVPSGMSSLLRYKGTHGKQNEDWDLRKRNRVILRTLKKKHLKICPRFLCAPSPQVSNSKMFQWAQVGWFYGSQRLDLQLTYTFITTTHLPKIRSAFCFSKFFSVPQLLLPLQDRKADLSWSSRVG